MIEGSAAGLVLTLGVLLGVFIERVIGGPGPTDPELEERLEEKEKLIEHKDAMVDALCERVEDLDAIVEELEYQRTELLWLLHNEAEDVTVDLDEFDIDPDQRPERPERSDDG